MKNLMRMFLQNFFAQEPEMIEPPYQYKGSLGIEWMLAMASRQN